MYLRQIYIDIYSIIEQQECEESLITVFNNEFQKVKQEQEEEQGKKIDIKDQVIFALFASFLISCPNDNYWKTLALCPEKIFNQNNYIPFMVNDPYIEKIKYTIDDKISTTRGRCKNCRGIVILNNCGNSVFQFKCFKCGINMGGEGHQNKNYERIDKHSIQKDNIQNLKELNEKGNFRQDLEEVPANKKFRELTQEAFWFGNFMMYTCWFFYLYFSGQQPQIVNYLMTDLTMNKGLNFEKTKNQKVTLIEIKKQNIIGEWTQNDREMITFLSQYMFNDLQNCQNNEIFVSFGKLEQTITENYFNNKTYIDDLIKTPQFSFKDSTESFLDQIIEQFMIIIGNVDQIVIDKSQLKNGMAYMTYEEQIDLYKKIIKLLEFLVYIQHSEKQTKITQLCEKYIQKTNFPQIFNDLTLEYIPIILETLEELQMDKLVEVCHNKFREKCEYKQKQIVEMIKEFKKQNKKDRQQELISSKYKIGRFIIRKLNVMDGISDSSWKLFEYGLFIYYGEEFKNPFTYFDIEIKHTKQFYDILKQEIDFQNNEKKFENNFEEFQPLITQINEEEEDEQYQNFQNIELKPKKQLKTIKRQKQKLK
ncbi:hypothetical protein PPERSA_10196 [Pseudocohnilembus persalinus]|uniref:Uncharacterized protein n=1 Tax=Pseudocohnilembus persalinus TaxID=266149 RepID=A0A0V0QLH8_PSEPJ|nr:hypothetical protein PPERSA_10196 [Pseudocohnilembus persalinus]|eukprot:KRX03115.1 hypothetical protein PPERSA_10196 [Pseudocohnilembus persalinus]